MGWGWDGNRNRDAISYGEGGLVVNIVILRIWVMAVFLVVK